MKIASMVLCAGRGSRLNSVKNKVLHEICGRPLAYWPIRNAMAVTDQRPIVVLGYQAEEVRGRLASCFGDSLRFALQEVQNGTGGAVKAALSHLEPDCHSVLVMCGDTPLLCEESLRRLVTIQQNSHVPVALMSAFCDDPYGYGRILRNSAQQICGIVEEEDATPLEREIKEINPAVYVFDAGFLRDSIDALTSENRKNELYLTDLVRNYIRKGPYHGPVGNLEISYDEMHGINDRRQLAYAQKILNRRLLDRWMIEGVTFIDPDHTYIEEGVRLSKDVVIYPGVHLRGETRVGEGAIIENGSVIKDTVIEKSAHILPHTCCDGAHIGEGARVGPFARLRPDTRLEDGVRVGNFVEIKGSRLKRGVKASHLAYIGDAEVGEGSNIGAGAITCNFDGARKHRTVIGEGTFIGSNTTMIAPLKIGDHAYVAGGSTINRDVPAKALAIARIPQTNKDGHRQIPVQKTT